MFTPAELKTLLGLVRKQNKDVLQMTTDEVSVELKLSQIVAAASEPHNPHKDFGHTHEGMNAATDAEAAASIK